MAVSNYEDLSPSPGAAGQVEQQDPKLLIALVRKPRCFLSDRLVLSSSPMKSWNCDLEIPEQFGANSQSFEAPPRSSSQPSLEFQFLVCMQEGRSCPPT